MTQPKTASKFTPGALRAAKLIAAEVIRLHNTVIVKGELNETAKQGWIVGIIDRETKAPEMYELLKKVKKCAETAASKPDKQEVCAILLEVVLPHLGEEARRIKAEIDGVE